MSRKKRSQNRTGAVAPLPPVAVAISEPSPPLPASPAPAAPAEPVKPTGFLHLVVTTAPIVLTLLATAFAGLSSSEMMRSMFYRSLAAQHQAKAGDQWAFFQAKRIRGTTLETTNDLLQGLATSSRFTPEFAEETLTRLIASLQKTGTPESLEAAAAAEKLCSPLTAALAQESSASWANASSAKLPRLEIPKLPDAVAQKNLSELLEAIQHRQTEGETAALVGRIPMSRIEEATLLAENAADRFDTLVQPVHENVETVRGLVRQLGQVLAPLRPVAGGRSDTTPLLLYDHLLRSFKATTLDFEARRYQAESAFNRNLAELYEARVRRSGVDSDRHRNRSALFFYCMLLAQVGVTGASLVLAREQRRYLLAVALASGFVALGFGGFVFTAY